MYRRTGIHLNLSALVTFGCIGSRAYCKVRLKVLIMRTLVFMGDVSFMQHTTSVKQMVILLALKLVTLETKNIAAHEQRCYVH